ncbi:unnamed protein product [Sphagnum balticum]
MKHFAAAMIVCLLCIVCSVGIQHGDISPEHVMRFVVANDSLCTAPYPDDYDIWLQPLNRALPHGDPRRMNDLSFRGSDFAMESSGTPSVI